MGACSKVATWSPKPCEVGSIPTARANLKEVRNLHVWTKDKVTKLLELHEQGCTHREKAEIMSDLFGERFNTNTIKKKIHRLNAKTRETVQTEYKETIEIQADGSHKSDKLLRMSAEQSKDVEYLLKAHGYDKNAWELVSARSNIWNAYSKQDGVQTLYASKITVKPKTNGISLDRLVKAIENAKPVIVKPKIAPLSEADYINLPLFDMHFGISDYEYYKKTQSKILGKLNKRYKGVLFIIGQDLFHNNDFQGKTASGREIERVDMEKAFDDVVSFYEPLIHEALEKSERVHIMYSKGNHDETPSFFFVKYLKARFPGASFDDRFRERKIHMLGKNFIGVNHGDKKKEQNLSENFATEFPIEWSSATTREVYTGHLHTERVIDKGGVIIRRMPTGNGIDQWHDDMGYTTAHKRFQIFEYSEESLESIHYV